jgi:hypothetical protein
MTAMTTVDSSAAGIGPIELARRNQIDQVPHEHAAKTTAA